jgi:hypothetical protein
MPLSCVVDEVKMSNNSSGAGLCLLIILYLAFFNGDTTSSYEEKTFYFMFCSDSKHNIYSCPKNEQSLLTSESFQISTERQDVVPKDVFIYSSDQKSDYQSCVVFDKNNWRCEMYGDGYYLVQDGEVRQAFADGSIRSSIDEKGNESPIPLFYQITYIEYLIRRLIQMV